MAKSTVLLFDVTYGQRVDPLVRDVTVTVEVYDDIRLTELLPLERAQIARHLRDLATVLEADSDRRALFTTGSRSLLLTTEAGTSVAYKDPL